MCQGDCPVVVKLYRAILTKSRSTNRYCNHINIKQEDESDKIHEADDKQSITLNIRHIFNSAINELLACVEQWLCFQGSNECIIKL